MFLDPHFSWHGGFLWWHGKLQGVIEALSKKRGKSFAEAREFLATKVASIELSPYHSTSFRNHDRLLENLHSVKLAREYVEKKLVPRAKSGKAIIIATRAVKHWNLPKHANIICYEGGHARGAHLTPNSQGGKAILKHLEY